MRALLLKEIKEKFNSASFYVIAAVFCLMAGVIFLNVVEQYESLIRANPGELISAQQYVVVNYFNNLNFLLILLIPILGMNSIAREQAAATMDLLMISSLGKYQVLFAKMFAQLIGHVFLLGLLSVYLICMAYSGINDHSYLFWGWVGLLLNGWLYVAIGMLCNSLFEKPSVAVGFLHIVALVLINSVHSIGTYFGAGFLSLTTYLSVPSHFLNIIRSSFYSADIVFYGLFILLAMFLAKRVLDWKEI